MSISRAKGLNEMSEDYNLNKYTDKTKIWLLEENTYCVPK